MKTVLVVVFHFPPLMEGSGYLRTLKFCEYLPEYGWSPVVLSVHPRAYAYSKVAETMPAFDFPVHRAFALDTRRHLSIMERYPSLLAIPDRWWTWCLGGIVEGMRAVRRHNPDLILSTQPIPSAHLLGLALERLTKLPWVADFRDPMLNATTPSEPLRRRAVGWIEAQTVRRCQRAVFTTPSCQKEVAARYPAIPASRFVMVQNGFDENAFAAAESARTAPSDPTTDAVTILHSGLLYRDLRDPTAFFQALSKLKKAGVICANRLRVKLRASGEESHYAAVLKRDGIDDIVSLEPGIAYQEALREMLEVDALLLIQGAAANRQIPAKAYEYLRAKRPIFALTDTDGDTNSVLRDVSHAAIAQIDSSADIATRLQAFVEQLDEHKRCAEQSTSVAKHSRVARTRELAQVLDDVCAPSGVAQRC